MAGVSFQPVTLNSANIDTEAMLVFSDGRLLAILTCLGDLHGGLQGQWFVEAMFAGDAVPPARTFERLAEFEQWVPRSDVR